MREDPGVLAKDDPKICPSRFEVKLISDLGRKMEGPKTMVQALETHVPEFLYPSRTVPAGVGAECAKGPRSAGEGKDRR